MSGNAYYSGKQTAKMTQQKTERTHHGPPRLGAWLLLSCAAACGGSIRKPSGIASYPLTAASRASRSNERRSSQLLLAIALPHLALEQSV